MKAEGGREQSGVSVVTRRSSLVTLLTCSVLLLVSLAAGAQEIKDGGPYVPTPQKVVDAMLELAKVGAGDFVMDLGSGDGRIVLTAATRFKARGLGLDIDQELVDRANGSAERLGIADRVRFVKQDVRVADLSEVTVLTLYLLPGMMTTLRPKLLKELKPGVRVVSHDFDFGDWKADRSVEVDTPEKYDMSGSWTSTVHLWVVPAPVQGTWRGALPGANGGQFQLQLRQDFQRFEGRIERGGKEIALRDGRIEGSRVRFTVPRDGGTEIYDAVVNGGQMTGEVRGNGVTSVKWSAARQP